MNLKINQQKQWELKDREKKAEGKRQGTEPQCPAVSVKWSNIPLELKFSKRDLGKIFKEIKVEKCPNSDESCTSTNLRSSVKSKKNKRKPQQNTS